MKLRTALPALALAAAALAAGCGSDPSVEPSQPTSTVVTTQTDETGTYKRRPNPDLQVSFQSAVEDAGLSGADTSMIAQNVCGFFDQGMTFDQIVPVIQGQLTGDPGYNQYPNVEVPLAPAAIMTSISARFYCTEYASKLN